MPTPNFKSKKKEEEKFVHLPKRLLRSITVKKMRVVEVVVAVQKVTMCGKRHNFLLLWKFWL